MGCVSWFGSAFMVTFGFGFTGLVARFPGAGFCGVVGWFWVIWGLVFSDFLVFWVLV